MNHGRNLSKSFHSIAELQDVLTILCNEQQLPPKYNDHSLSGNYEGHRECHITLSTNCSYQGKLPASRFLL
ncbi:MAG: type II toxin-antitoxin system YafQ family toxin [Lachnospiraceae bacterium]|nr:type II toxin-antitoxin system YafQ family toxin [Lachnospiraceae bacterium]